MRVRLKRLERLAEEEMIVISQLDGPPKKFPPEAAEEAFLVSLERLKGHLHIPAHPLSTPAANSSDSHWRNSFTAGTHTVVGGEIPPDLSE